MVIELSGSEIFFGILTLIFVIISTILGLSIAFKYMKFRRIDFLAVGFTWLFLISPYWSNTIQFIIGMIFRAELASNIYIFLANAFIAPIHITWIYAFSNLMYKNHKKILLVSFGSEAILFEIVFIVIFCLNPALIGYRKSTFVVEWAIWIQIYLLFSIALFLITGFLLARESIISGNAKLRIKGRFLLIAFISFTVGAIMDIFGAYDPTELLISLARTFMIISSICFYIGYILPKFIKNYFIKE